MEPNLRSPYSRSNRTARRRRVLPQQGGKHHGHICQGPHPRLKSGHCSDRGRPTQPRLDQRGEFSLNYNSSRTQGSGRAQHTSCPSGTRGVFGNSGVINADAGVNNAEVSARSTATGARVKTGRGGRVTHRRIDGDVAVSRRRSVGR